MFPETFVEKHLAATRFDGVVFDPFCGRGTTIFESLIRKRKAAGCDVHPVAFCVSGAKSDPPAYVEIVRRLSALEEKSIGYHTTNEMGGLEEFFRLCFSESTYNQVSFLRDNLSWYDDRVDRFIAAICLGALHGESHRSPNYFSNRMPRTISTKPGYSVRWWRKHGYRPPTRDVFSIIRYMCDYRFKSSPPSDRGEVSLSDARAAACAFPHLSGRVTDIITSPPYLDTTNYREDQWLRLWFLGCKATDRHSGGDGRHYNVGKYWRFLAESWLGLAPLLASEARFVVRIGGRRLTREATLEALMDSLEQGLGRRIHLLDNGVSSIVRRTQSNAFRGRKPSPTIEYDFCFVVS